MANFPYPNETIPGTRELFWAVMKESQPQPSRGPAWRPVRAAVLKAMTQLGWDRYDGLEFMTPTDFADWIYHQGLFKRGSLAVLDKQIGMGRWRRDAIFKGSYPTRVEALACAHYGLKLRLPVRPGDAAGFRQFVETNFGRPTYLARTLGLIPAAITMRMDGFQIVRGERVERLPQVGLIRAIDWIYRVGPYSPFGKIVDARYL